jgi:pyruvate kinase
LPFSALRCDKWRTETAKVSTSVDCGQRTVYCSEVLRKTKIIATLGPATDSREVIEKLIERGMNVARLNFSHGDHEDHKRRFDLVRQVASDLDVPIAIMQDIQGPKIRVGRFPGGSVQIEPGSIVTLLPDEAMGDAENIHIAYLADVAMDVGGKIILSDGLIELESLEVSSSGITAKVLGGGILRDHKGAAFPGARTRIPIITPKDIADLEFGAKLGVDFVAASFVNSRSDVEKVKAIIGDTPVIAKIETAVGLENLDEILECAAGAMVARGDLGVELSIEYVPRAQSEIVERTNAAGRLSIVATEMLESMISSPRPTRAEVSDVYQSVLDGADAVMLSAETAVGKYPTRAVRLMAKVCKEAEQSSTYGRAFGVETLSHDEAFASATTEAAVDTAGRLGIGTIVAFTESGTSARLLAKYRPKADIRAFTPEASSFRRMALYGGVTAILVERAPSTDEMLQLAVKELLDRGIVSEGDGVVLVAGVPPNQRSSTNLMKLHVIGSTDRLAPGPVV